MKARKLALMLSITLGITSLCPYTANASVYNGWEKNNGYWYYNLNGSRTNGWQNDMGTWYYLNSDGSMKTGWLNDNGTWYYLNADGSMAHDTSIDGYKLNSNGAWVSDNTIANTNKNYTFTEGLNKFSVDSACSILNKQDKTKNSNYSPVSLFMALSVLSEGADNNTKTELMNALNISNPDALSKECQNLYKSLSFNNENGICKIADSIWVDNDNNEVEFNEDTLKKIENDYDAGLFKCNLQSDDTASKISDWISSHTNGKLGTNPSEFKITNPEEVMEIFNAIYFKDSWADQFSTDTTNKDKFYLSDGSSVDTDFMHQSVTCNIYSGNGYKSSSLDFMNGNKMMFILPDEGRSPYEVLENGANLQNALNSLSEDKGVYSEVSFSVPKFDYKTSMDINECADDLGIKSIYDSNADFTKYSKKGDLRVSKIKQDATVTIDENGAEAAAYTQIGITCGSALIENHDDMNLNRPFIFDITDNNNTPLFIGVVNNPTLK